MSLLVYNTLTRKKENFETLEKGKVKMYCCGPTVYNLLHVGNFRGPVFYNLVRNWLEKNNYEVTYVYNYTDVDDRIIDRAIAEKVEASVISERYIEEFKKDYASLGLGNHSMNPKVSEHMPDIINMIQKLIDNKKAYVVDGEVLYSIESFPQYGQLSNRNVEELKAGVRIDPDPKKKNPMDFALWKPAKPGEPSWDSPWSKGRPGWHIECSAMNYALLGEQIDIHGGGLDLVFPHHENELAQTEGCTHKPFAKYWMHNNMLNFGGQKMSKSVGNVTFLRDFLKIYHPEIYKFLILSSHYRSVADFSESSIEHAIGGLARIYSALATAEVYMQDASVEAQIDGKFAQELIKANEGVASALNDDFNTPEVMAKVFEAVRSYNAQVKKGLKANAALKGKSQQLIQFLRETGKLMGLFQESAQSFLVELDNLLLKKMNLDRMKIDQIVVARSEARKNKDFKKSDEYRDELLKMGIAVCDTPQGSTWEVQK